MASSSIPGFITKAEAAQRYKRDIRNIGKDISVALAIRNEDFLKHLKLRTKDEKIREGIDVTPELILELRDKKKDRKGMVPTWYLEVAYFDSLYLENKYGDEGVSDEKVMKDAPPIFDAETVEETKFIDPDNDDSGALALLTHPMIQTQANQMRTQEKRIRELEKDHDSDRQVIATLRETIELLNKHVKKESGTAKSTSSDGNTDHEGGKQGTTKLKKKPKTAKKRNNRKSSISTKATAEKKPPKKNTKIQAKKTQKKKWYNTPISKLFSN